MKYKKALLDQLGTLPFFTKAEIISLSRQYGIRERTVDTHINRSLAGKDLIRLRRGMYVTAQFFETNRGDHSYIYYLANVLRTPSYVTSWAALQYYNLTTEAILTLPSATPKVTRSYRTKAANFIYQSIHDDLFSGYTLIKEKFSFFMASPSKALFDLLYFKTRQMRGVRTEAITGIVEGCRIDLNEMDKKEQGNFQRLIKEHLG